MTAETKRVSPVTFFLCGLAAVLLYGISGGIRCDIGILLKPLMEATGLSYQEVSFAIAVMQLSFGAFQPLFGLIAARRSNRFVLTLGVCLYLAGLASLPFIHSMAALIVAVGILIGAGAGAISFGIILAAVVSAVGPKNGAMISGFINAAAGLGSTILSPVIEGAIAGGGLPEAAMRLSLPAALLLPVIFYLTTRKYTGSDAPAAKEPSGDSLSAREIFRSAFASHSFRCLVCGFSTCGFHMVIIEAHLYSQFVSYGIARAMAARAYGFYGVATVLGSLIAGYLSTRIHKGKLLAFYYGFRAVWVALYLLLLPKTFATACLFSVGLGLTGGASVPPTSGVVNEHFPLAQTATLIGLLFLCHQVGAFLSASLGGVCVNLTGSYVAIWCVDIVLCCFASFASSRI
jgi:MFS family permease